MNYYDLLGVKPTASIDEIRQAYLAKMRIIHPDKIDVKKDPQSWKEANHLSSLVNEAYSVLRDIQKRVEYDKRISNFNEGRYRHETNVSPEKQQEDKGINGQNKQRQHGETAATEQERNDKRQEGGSSEKGNERLSQFIEKGFVPIGWLLAYIVCFFLANLHVLQYDTVPLIGFVLAPICLGIIKYLIYYRGK